MGLLLIISDGLFSRGFSRGKTAHSGKSKETEHKGGEAAYYGHDSGWPVSRWEPVGHLQGSPGPSGRPGPKPQKSLKKGSRVRSPPESLEKVSKKSGESEKKSRKGPERLIQDFFQTLGGPRDFFQTFRGFGPGGPARLQAVNGQRVPKSVGCSIGCFRARP